MATDGTQPKHKSGPLKQTNKPHKHGRHRTKGQIENTNKGKVDVKALSKKNKLLDRQQRRHQAKQIRKNKFEEILEKKRKLGTQHSPPHVIALLPLSCSCNCDELLEFIRNSDDSIVSSTKNRTNTLISTRHRQRFTVIYPNPKDLYSVLDAGKVADTFLFVVPANGDIDELNKRWLTYLVAQGLPATIHAIQGLKHIPVKKQHEVKKSINKQLEKWFPEVKLHVADNAQDAGIILRLIANQKQKSIYHRDRHPYMVANNIETEADESDDKNVTLKISGYLRGKNLSVNGLVHLPGLGDFQMKQIDLPKDPYTIKKKTEKKSNSMDEDNDIGMEEDIKVITVRDPSKQTSLISEAEIDPMDAEQTWPTEEELKAADEAAGITAANNDDGRQLKKVPKGTSEYQAAWILDEYDNVDEEDSEDDESDLDGMEEAEDVDEDSENEEGEEDFDTISVAATTIANDERYDEHFDLDLEQKELEKYKLERENEMFPDEVDTPMGIPARERFQRYRGLKSFRTSPWDRKENLPLDYARIFQFQNFNRSKKKILKGEEDEDEQDCAMVGSYATVHISKVPKVYIENWNPDHPLVVFGLLPHEQKMTVMNFALKRHQTFGAPVKAKERLVFHIGYRRFVACPIFSQHTTADKFKAERFLPQTGVTVATVYAPIMFPPASVLVFTEDHQLVATGTCLGSNPNRIVVKKIVLSGHPFKINKRSSVVRYMFFNRDDILWFKPVEVLTKYGRRGHIKEPLGTHGHMKCVFDGPLKAQDTVCMNLYKRIFPQWTYESCVVAPAVEHHSVIDDEGDIKM